MIVDLTTMRRFRYTPRTESYGGGVYFLFDDEELVYIGRSQDIAKRLDQHQHSKKFDHYSFIECDGDERDELEADLIRLHKPKYNACWLSGRQQRTEGENRPTTYLEQILSLGLSQEEAGVFFGTSSRTGQRWASDGPPFLVKAILDLGMSRDQLNELMIAAGRK